MDKLASHNPQATVVRTIVEGFFPARGLELAARGLAPDAPVRVPTDDFVINEMGRQEYVRLDAVTQPERPLRGKRNWVVVFVLKPDGKYARHSPDLKKLLATINLGDPRLDELIVVTSDDFFGRAPLVEAINEFRETRKPDDVGTLPYFNVYWYGVFTLVVPDHESVPPHRVMTDEETEQLLRENRKALQDLPAISASDPPIIWAGGRPGQVVEIRRDSQTAIECMYYRRIVN